MTDHNTAPANKPALVLISDRYEPIGKLGQGGMAEVWLGRMHGMSGFNRKVVLKFLRPEHVENQEYVDMFVDEAQVGSMLDHPGIPRVEELGEQGGVPYMVQEYVDGPSLHQLVKAASGPLPLRAAAQIVADVARSLHYANEAPGDDGRPLKLVHRDVSLSNVLVSARGQTKLIDFGVAKFDQRDTQTQVGMLKGKLRYMAPEAFRGQTSHRGDLYSLGVVAYALFAGKAAWGKDGGIGDRQNITPPSTHNPELAPELEALVLQCLALKSDDRPTDGTALANQLEAWLKANGGPVMPNEISALITERFPERKWRALAVADPTSSLPGVSISRSIQAPAPVATSNALRNLGFALGGLIVLGLLGGAAWLATQGDPPAAVSQRTETAATALLQRAEASLTAGDIGAAATLLDQAKAEPSPTDTERAKITTLTTQIGFASQLQLLEGLVDSDPKGTLERALTLDQQYPGRPQIAALVSKAQAALATPDSPAPAAQPAPRPASPPSATSKPAPAGPSQVTLDGSPAGATVLVDGNLVGNLPLTVGLPAGEHTVQVRSEGHTADSRTVTVVEGRDLQLQFALASEAPAEAWSPGKLGSANDDDAMRDPFAPTETTSGLADPFE